MHTIIHMYTHTLLTQTHTHICIHASIHTLSDVNQVIETYLYTVKVQLNELLSVA